MNTENLLKRTRQLAKALNQTNSKNEKRDAIAVYADDEDIKKLLQYVYDPLTVFNVTSRTVLKFGAENGTQHTANVYASLFDLLDALRDRAVTGYQALVDVNAFIRLYSEYIDILLKILDKNLELRVDVSTINKAIPNLITTFDVALAQDYAKRINKVDFNKQEFRAMRKLDGVRVLAVCDKAANDITFYSRNGKEFTSLDVVRDALMPVLAEADYSFVLDGEICVVDEDGAEDFKAAVSQIKRKSATMQTPRYYVFDCLTMQEFQEKRGYQKYTDRISRAPMLNIDEQVVCSVPSWPVQSHEGVARHQADAEKMGWEGLILRADVGYEGKRTNNLLKVKSFFDEEFQVLATENEEHRIIVDGKQVKQEVLARVFIDYKGTRVGVGSGFSKEERIAYGKHPETLIGKILTIQYFEESKDKTGKVSLRFPTVKFVHGDERQV